MPKIIVFCVCVMCVCRVGVEWVPNIIVFCVCVLCVCRVGVEWVPVFCVFCRVGVVCVLGVLMCVFMFMGAFFKRFMTHLIYVAI